MIFKKIENRKLILFFFSFFLFVCIIVRNVSVSYNDFTTPRYFDIVYTKTKAEYYKNLHFSPYYSEKIRVTDKDKVGKVINMIKGLPLKKVNIKSNEEILNSKVEAYLTFTTRKNDYEDIKNEEYNKEYDMGDTILLGMIVFENKKVIITFKRPYGYTQVDFEAPITDDDLQLIRQEMLSVK